MSHWIFDNAALFKTRAELALFSHRVTHDAVVSHERTRRDCDSMLARREKDRGRKAERAAWHVCHLGRRVFAHALQDEMAQSSVESIRKQRKDARRNFLVQRGHKLIVVFFESGDRGKKTLERGSSAAVEEEWKFSEASEISVDY
jgi:hypothetical protein